MKRGTPSKKDRLFARIVVRALVKKGCVTMPHYASAMDKFKRRIWWRRHETRVRRRMTRAEWRALR